MYDFLLVFYSKAKTTLMHSVVRKKVVINFFQAYTSTKNWPWAWGSVNSTIQDVCSLDRCVLCYSTL